MFNGGDGMRPTQGGQIQGVQIGGGSKIYIQQQPHQGIITHVSRYFSKRVTYFIVNPLVGNIIL